MDTLDHMTLITDPLDSGGGSEGRIMEECMLGNTRVSLPEDLLEDPEIFFSVLSESTWSNVLTDAQRQRLRQLLPQFPENCTAQQDSVISDLFNNKNFHFGNPVHLAQKLFRDGYFNPEVVKYRQLCAKSQKKRQLYFLQQYYHRLLKQILISRKELLEQASRSGPDFKMKRRYPSPSCGETQELRARWRFSRILREVKNECGDSSVSSDDEDMGSWLPDPQSPSSPAPTVSLRFLPSLSTQDMKITEKPELEEKDLRALLRRHKEKRKRQPDHPDLMTSDLHLGDIMSRVNIGRKGSGVALFDLAIPKKRIREEKKKKKFRPIKMEPEEPGDVLMASEAPPPGATVATTVPEAPVPPSGVKEELMDEVQDSPAVVEEIAVSFFNLLEDILKMEGQATASTLEEKVQQWQASPASTLNPWFSLAPCWSELILPALQFLSGENRAGVMSLPTGFSPLVEYQEHTQQWKWLSPSQDCEKDLSALCQLWLEAKDQVVVKQESEEAAELTPPAPRVWTDYVVRPSTGEERHFFQEQEQQRYDQPHKAFTFRMHGFESVVGPVKGVFDKETSLNKAREHSLLRSDRPAYVTILSLVRDAAARLPNGEGTRAEICELLKDSQFLAPDVTSAQVNTVVSGALDRLHYEKDPCVKYDIGRKLWIYLHRDRSQEEFERIHQAQAAAAKAKKALQQKPKPAPKPKSSKEGSGKVVGASEQIVLSEGGAVSAVNLLPTPVTPTPSTPGTPKSPLAPAATTPTKTGVPDTVKQNPSVLLVSPPSIPQLGTLLSTSQSVPPAPQPTGPQPATRVVAHPGPGSLPQVRVVTAQPSLTAPSGSQQATLVHPAQHQIRVPVSMAHTKGLTQAVVTLPLRTATSSSSVQVQATRGQPGITVAGLASAITVSKPQSSTPGSPAQSVTPPAMLQGVTSQNIIKQVAITGQLGVKSQGTTGIPLTATNLRIQGKDVLRLPPSSITTDAKGQTVLRITPDMMATLAKSPVTTVKLTPEMLSAAAAGGSKGISATLHVTSSHPSPPSSSALAPPPGDSSTIKAAASLVKVHPELKAGGDTAIRLMPALAVTVADQKGRGFSTVSSDSKPATTIRIMPSLGVIPQKQGQTLTVTTTTAAKLPAATTGAATVTIATSGVAGAKSLTMGPATTGSPISIGAGAATVRQVPVSATVVSTQPGKLPARITVPLSVLSQPLKSKSVVTSPILKGNISTNISNLGRNIILTTMPAGTKLIAGNKPVSFVTAQQLQQLQQQGQATQVRIQTVPAQQLQQRTVAGSPKPLSTVVVTTAPSPKRTPDPQ
ncbi:nuclear factor related to kappa-B-binding protein isoform X3 [Arapaima gigas]